MRLFLFNLHRQEMRSGHIISYLDFCWDSMAMPEANVLFFLFNLHRQQMRSGHIISYIQILVNVFR